MANRNSKDSSEMSFAEMREILASLVKQGQAQEVRFAGHESRMDRLEARMEKNARRSEERFDRLETQIAKNEQRAKKRDELLDRKFRTLQGVVNLISEQTIALQNMQQQNELRFMRFDEFLNRVEEALRRLAVEQTELARKLKDLIDLDRRRRSNGHNDKRN